MGIVRKYGWKKDLHDPRDFVFRPKLTHAVTALPMFSSNPENIPVYNQGQVGSCTGNGWAFAYDYELQKAGLPRINPSRLKIYYDERVEAGEDVNEDSGAQIRDGIKVIARNGVCPESMWPYIESQFNVKPPQACYDASLKHLGLTYARVNQDEQSVLSTLIGGNPIVFGFNVYESFEGDEIAKTGIMPLPEPGETMCGGHCVAATNYHQHFEMPDGNYTKMIRCRNSWGDGWGDKGHFFMPESFFLDIAMTSDCWVLTQVS
jgi:C1A family cysteine protease